MLSVALLTFFVGVWSVTTSSQSVMPTPRQQFLDNNGNPCASCRLYAYVAGTSTPQNTFTDATLGTPNDWPVELDSAGRATVFLDDTLAYKFTLSTAADVPIWTVDNVSGSLVGLVSITVANTRGLRITRNNAEAGLSIASSGGSGKTYGIASTTAGALVIQDDADGTPNITINTSNQIVLTATGGVSIPNTLFATGGIQFGGSIRATSAITPPALAAHQNDYNPTGLATANRIRLATSGGARNITGLAAQADGHRIVLQNLGPDQITLLGESASSTATNRFAAQIIFNIGELLEVIYDGTASRWYVVH